MRIEQKAWLIGSLPTWIIAIAILVGIFMGYQHGLTCRKEALEMKAQLVHVMRMQALTRTAITETSVARSMERSPRQEFPPLPQGIAHLNPTNAITVGAAGGSWLQEIKKLRAELQMNGALP